MPLYNQAGQEDASRQDGIGCLRHEEVTPALPPAAQGRQVGRDPPRQLLQRQVLVPGPGRLRCVVRRGVRAGEKRGRSCVVWRGGRLRRGRRCAARRRRARGLPASLRCAATSRARPAVSHHPLPRGSRFGLSSRERSRERSDRVASLSLACSLARGGTRARAASRRQSPSPPTLPSSTVVLAPFHLPRARAPSPPAAHGRATRHIRHTPHARCAGTRAGRCTASAGCTGRWRTSRTSPRSGGRHSGNF